MNKLNNFRIILPVTLLLAATLACNTPQPTVTPDLAAAVAQTQTAIAVSQFLTSTAPAPVDQNPAPTTPPPSPQAPTETSTLLPSATPTPVPTVPNCTDKAKLVSETIPDDSTFGAGEKFMKTWTLQNVGTCTWTAEYAMIFNEGDQMEGYSPTPIGQAVAPNGTIQLFLPQTAPAQPGTYQGFWKLRSPSGREFGLGQEAEKAFWIKINVTAASPTSATVNPLNLGAPAWSIDFENGSGGFYTGSDDTTVYSVEDGAMVMSAPTSKGDFWRISSFVISNGYIEGKFRTGDACSGKDAYGFLLRAPDQPDSIIDSGYVFAFSCEGKYRIYRMDNGSFTSIKGWAAANAIQSGPEKSNSMGIYANGDKFQLYANSVLLFEFNDSTYASGYLG